MERSANVRELQTYKSNTVIVHPSKHSIPKSIDRVDIPAKTNIFI